MPKTTKKEIPVEEVVKLKEEGMSYEKIAEQMRKQGIEVSEVTIGKKITEYYEKKIKAKKSDDSVKYILMNGMTTEDYVSKFGKEDEREQIELTLRKLKFLANHLDKKDGQWVSDNNFDLLLSNVESNAITATQDKVSALLKNGQCKRKELKDIIDIQLDGNVELAVYILTRLKPLCTKGAFEDFIILKTQYEQKIDKYIEKLHTIERNIARNKAECYELPQKRETEDVQK